MGLVNKISSQKLNETAFAALPPSPRISFDRPRETGRREVLQFMVHECSIRTQHKFVFYVL
jgi:hypothetical protein